MNRSIFSLPIRYTTEEFYPDKLSIDEFKDEIVGSFGSFYENMKNLKGVALEEKYMEEWCEQYLAWLEVEEKKSGE